MSKYDEFLSELATLYPAYKRFWQVVRELDQKILAEFCNMGYKDECRPWYCEFRVTGTCRFWLEYSKIQKLLRERGILIECSWKRHPSEVLSSEEKTRVE